MPSVITLLTDFGTADGYVGELKGVLATRAPRSPIVDVAHDIPAHDIDAGRLALERYWRSYPPGSVHLAIVDPGVGTARAALAVEASGQFLVGPDNGILSSALVQPAARVVSVPVPPSASPTFHGRDVFALVAARLANGAKVNALGEAFDALILFWPEPRKDSRGVMTGEVIGIDRFGNAITNLALRPTAVEVAGHTLPVALTYSDLEQGSAGAVVGSSGLIEIVVHGGRAANELGLKKGAPVRAM